MTDLTQGSPAPDFTLPRDGEGSVTLSALRGGPVVLYFYPRDDTPGCTTEAIDFTALRDEFRAAGATVFGISTDSISRHDKFTARHQLRVSLLSDEEAKVATAYGAWVEKNMYGRKSMGVQRSTILIDAAGRIARHWPKVKVAGHAQEVLEAVRTLAA